MTSSRYWNTMIRCHAKAGKDRTKSRRPKGKAPLVTGVARETAVGKPR